MWLEIYLLIIYIFKFFFLKLICRIDLLWCKSGNVVLWLCCKGKCYEVWLFMYCDWYEVLNYCVVDVLKGSINVLCCKSWWYDVLLYCVVEVGYMKYCCIVVFWCRGGNMKYYNDCIVM